MCLFSNPLDRLFSRAMHLFPTDSRHPGAALKIATRVLEPKQCASLVPRGPGLSDRSLRRFLPGIGQLLLRSGAPAVPAYYRGRVRGVAPGRRITKFRRTTVTYGRPGPVASCVQGASAGPTRGGLPMRCASVSLLLEQNQMAWPGQLSSLITLPILSAVLAGKPAV